MRITFTFVLAALAATCLASSSVPVRNKVDLVSRSPKETTAGKGELSAKCGGFCDGGPWNTAFQYINGGINTYSAGLTYTSFGQFSGAFGGVLGGWGSTIGGWGGGLPFDPFYSQLQGILIQMFNVVSPLAGGCGFCMSGMGIGGFGDIFTSFFLQIQQIIQICTGTYGGYLGQLGYASQMLTVIIRLVIGIGMSAQLNMGGLFAGAGIGYGIFNNFGIQIQSLLAMSTTSLFTTGLAGWSSVSAFGGMGGMGGGLGYY